MDTYQTITTRRTIRLFNQKPISPDLIDRILNAGRIAPSAANRQVLEFIVVREPLNCDLLFHQLAWAGYVQPKRNPPPGKQPTLYIIVLVRDQELNPVNSSDAGAAMENMILTAWNENVGSCWIGSVVNHDVVKRQYEIPADYHIFGVLALGYPAEQPVMEEMAGSIKYWLDENDRLHVPKRPLKDIAHYETFTRRTPGE
ncbi:MAG: nitroreductase family protein [Phycisphaerae bacterium]